MRARNDIDSALQRKGFVKDEGDHSYYIYWNISGKKTIRKTKMSHGTSHKEIGDPLLGQMARQLGLTKKDFLQLVDCTIDQEMYEKIVFSE